MCLFAHDFREKGGEVSTLSDAISFGSCPNALPALTLCRVVSSLDSGRSLVSRHPTNRTSFCGADWSPRTLSPRCSIIAPLSGGRSARDRICSSMRTSGKALLPSQRLMLGWPDLRVGALLPTLMLPLPTTLSLSVEGSTPTHNHLERLQCPWCVARAARSVHHQLSCRRSVLHQKKVKNPAGVEPTASAGVLSAGGQRGVPCEPSPILSRSAALVVSSLASPAEHSTSILRTTGRRPMADENGVFLAIVSLVPRDETILL
jgi:hypothetical protein